MENIINEINENIKKIQISPSQNAVIYSIINNEYKNQLKSIKLISNISNSIDFLFYLFLIFLFNFYNNFLMSKLILSKFFLYFSILFF